MNCIVPVSAECAQAVTHDVQRRLHVSSSLANCKLCRPSDDTNCSSLVENNFLGGVWERNCIERSISLRRRWAGRQEASGQLDRYHSFSQFTAEMCPLVVCLSVCLSVSRFISWALFAMSCGSQFPARSAGIQQLLLLPTLLAGLAAMLPFRAVY